MNPLCYSGLFVNVQNFYVVLCLIQVCSTKRMVNALDKYIFVFVLGRSKQVCMKRLNNCFAKLI